VARANGTAGVTPGADSDGRPGLTVILASFQIASGRSKAFIMLCGRGRHAPRRLATS
jgi:hypothetical protein